MAAGLVGVACITGAPAAADDQMFADALAMIGVSVGDPVAAAAVGQGVCASFDAGISLPTVVDQIADSHALSTEDASMVTGFAVAEYCDQHESALRTPQAHTAKAGSAARCSRRRHNPPPVCATRPISPT